jgi:hypothetical protein
VRRPLFATARFSISAAQRSCPTSAFPHLKYTGGSDGARDAGAIALLCLSSPAVTVVGLSHEPIAIGVGHAARSDDILVRVGPPPCQVVDDRPSGALASPTRRIATCP